MASPVTDDLLRRNPLFRRLSPEHRAHVAALSRLVGFERGEVIFAEGDPADMFLTIVEGHVKVFKTTSGGKEVILEVFGPGDPLGAVAIYENVPFPASAVALEHAQLLRIAQRDFFQLLEQHPALVRGLLSGLTIRLAELTRRLADLSGARVESRFARLFLKLADQIGRPRDGGTFVPMPLSRQELADLTGTTIETAIRTMSRWHRENVLHTEKEGFLLLDRDSLEETAS